MANRITLEEIKKLLSTGKADQELLDDMNAIMGLIVFFAPLAAGLPPGTVHAIVEALEKREALVKAGERLISKLAGVGAGDELDKCRRIEAAHLLITYSAFFDSVSKHIPGFWKKLALDESVQKYLMEGAARSPKAFPRVAALPPAIPHPLTKFDVHLDQLRGCYQALSEVLASFLETLKIVDIEAAAKANEYAVLKKSIVDEALDRYQAQYVELAAKFPEFHIYANFRFQIAADQRLRALADAADLGQKQADIGFQKLAGAIEQMGRAPAAQTLADLRARYDANSRRPVFPKSAEGLTFPARIDIFIPQAYRALRYTVGTHVDSEELWEGVPVNQDLGLFLTRCLESPYSMEAPLLVLGQPGCGKSMLTHMIGSVLGGRFDTIRVELGSVHADARLYAQVEESISQQTQGRRVTWPELRGGFTAPPVLILDGFDELLQATGKVFAAYLEDCAEFQRDAMDLHRPVRILVTSRITLINRVHIPEDTIVVRLEEFDRRRQKQWIEIWNRHNQGFFSDPARNAQPFELNTSHDDVQKLARQPLLLLMLAIYDSDHNRLAQQGKLNRTALYYSLIRSFVEREEGRAHDFQSLSPAEQDERIETEIRRLGVAGLSMYNRRKREIHQGELDEALAAFQLTYPTTDQGQPLGQAERLFARFFFVLKAESPAAAAAGGTAYEFLHATFAEFLAAYSIARELVETCENLLAQKAAARRDYVQKPDTFPRTWFECLMHAPLFNQPVVLTMLREWVPQAAGKQFDAIIAQLEAVVLGQTSMLLEGGRLPEAFRPLPALGHAAIYSVNLVTAAAVLREGKLVIQERNFQSYPDETRPWDRLTFLWRSWFSLRVLANLGGVLTARRENNEIHIVASKQIEEHSLREPGLDRLFAAASGLGDHVLLGLSGYFLADAVKRTQPTLEEVEGYLQTEGYSLGVFSAFRKIPLEHSGRSDLALLSIVRDPMVPNWEFWVRAIWVMTSQPNFNIRWSSIPMIRELHRGCEHLFAPIASPQDCAEFYSDHSSRPVQLTFAKRSGGKQRYKETYERVLKNAPEANWSPEEYAAVYEAASYFGDTNAIQELQKAKGAAWIGISALVTRLTGLPASLSRPQLLGIASDFAAKTAPSGALMSVLVNALSVVMPILTSAIPGWGASLGWVYAQANPYMKSYPAVLRKLKERKANYARLVLDLMNCLDLPADVQIELLDMARSLPVEQQNADFLKRLEFPLDRVGEITLDSMAAARRVAQWLGDDRALREIDQRIQESAAHVAPVSPPPAPSTPPPV